jgi:hypothetical protein
MINRTNHYFFSLPPTDDAANGAHAGSFKSEDLKQSFREFLTKFALDDNELSVGRRSQRYHYIEKIR